MRQLSKVAGSANDSQYHSKGVFNNYFLADSLIPFTSIVCSILACKVVYDLTKLISNNHFEAYSSLTKIQKTEWNNRGLSTIHAIFITYAALYFVFGSDLFSDNRNSELITFRSSPWSTFSLGVSVGYFLVDLGMICWLYPSLGGWEYILHHSLSATAVAYSMWSREGQLYTFMVLISEMTTPEINLRCFDDCDNSSVKCSVKWHEFSM